MTRKDTESRGKTTNSMLLSPTILGCSLQNAPESRTSSPGIVQLLWRELVARIDPLNSSTKTSQRSWRNSGCLGFLDIYQNRIIRMLFLTQSTDTLRSIQIFLNCLRFPS